MERYAGILFRYRTADFARSGDFPAATADPDWPFGYERLRPFYDELERKLGIARDSGADPTEPPSCPPVMPPHQPSLLGTRINAAFDDLDTGHFPTPLGINSQPYGGRPACSHCGFCNGTACPTGAKASMLRVHEAPGDTVLVQGARAEAIHVGVNGEATAVECVDAMHGSRAQVRARTFILAAGALNTCALLLRSTSRLHPHGLGNARNQVGKGIQFKLTGYATTLDPALTSEDGPTLYSTTATTDYYEQLPIDGCGGLIYESAVPNEPHMARVHFVVAESPMIGNSVMPARFGRPGPNVIIQHEYLDDDVKRLRSLGAVSQEVLARVNPAVDMVEEPNSTGRAHLAGGCRSGTDPYASVVDSNGRLHDSDNVYIVDASFFPYAAAVNPTFTIMANSLRISRALTTNHSGAS